MKQLVIKYGTGILFILSIIDASIFAMPVTTFFLFLTIIKKANIFRYVISILTGTIIGALAVYGLGHLALIKGEDFLTGMAQSIMDHSLGFSISLYYNIRILYKTWGYWLLLVAPFTPVPYGMLSISS